MKRILIEEAPAKPSQSVKIAGWVWNRRDHGKIIFIDIRDKSGILQSVFLPAEKDVYALAEKLRPGWVIEVEGEVAQRPAGMINKDLATGEIELQIKKLKILNEAETSPLALETNGMEIGEEVRMKYRYLDLRRPRLQKNIRFRHQVNLFIRHWLTEKGFVEIETPILTKSTPEGARDYVVPFRRETGKFYALPQSPQQYKQLLMVAGFENYFQIARCFRDEDTRGDRQPEFTQLDLEMSFVEREDVMALNEALLVDLVKKLTPHKKIQELPFPRMSYAEAISKYGTDRPDLRKDKNDPDLLAFCWVIDFPFFEKADNGGWTFTHNPFSAPQPEHLPWLMHKEKIGEILTTQYDVALNGFEIGGGSIRNHQPEPLKKVFEIMGFKEEKILANFGHMLSALGYGAPPHGGIAWGLDRLISILTSEPNIREVFSFPKTGDGRDLMMDSPSEISKEQLQELHLEIKKKS